MTRVQITEGDLQKLIAAIELADSFERNIRAQSSFGYEGQDELRRAISAALPIANGIKQEVE